MVNLYAGMFELVVCVVHGDLDSKHCSNIILCSISTFGIYINFGLQSAL